MFQPLEIIPKDSLKDVLQKQISKTKNIPLPIVEEVLAFTFSETKKAFKIHTEVEVSGFGKFRIVPKRLEKKLAKAESKMINAKKLIAKETNEQKIRTLEIKLHNATTEYEFLKSKKDELTTNL